MKRALFLVLGVLGSSLALPALASHDSHLALGSENTVFELRKGTYGELFPDGTEVAGSNVVLALDVVSSDGSRQRWLVPATGSADSENSELLVYQHESDRVYLFWEAVISGIHPTLFLVSFDGAEWGELIQFMGSPFARKQSLQLVISHDSGPVRSADEQGSQDLTVLHVFWAEERPGTTSVKRYAPIFIVDGEYLGSTPVYDLDDFFTDSPATGPPVSPDIADAIRAQAGKSTNSYVIGFLGSSTHRLNTLKVELLPEALIDFARKVRAEIIGIGAKAVTPPELAQEIEERIWALGLQFHRSVLAHIVERTRQSVDAAQVQLSEEGLTSLADKVRAEIIGIGAKIGPNGLLDDQDFKILEIVPPAGEARLIKVTPVSSREAPEVGSEAKLWLSESGRHVLVTWEDQERIYFRKSLDEGGWSETGSIDVGGGLDRGQIYRTLSDRIRTR